MKIKHSTWQEVTEYKKDFDSWNILKKELQTMKNAPTFKEGEVWWCQIGANIGFEEDGKNLPFERPVMIFRKYSKNLFFGLPLTTAQKSNEFHFELTNSKTKGSIILSQGRTLSAKRLNRRMYTIDSELTNEIRMKHNALLLPKKSKSPHKTGKSQVAFANLYSNYSKPNAKSQVTQEEN
jgi:mRNA interferase MazF